MKRLILSGALIALVSTPCLAQKSLVFATETTTTSNGGATVLDEFDDQELVSFTPADGAIAKKLVSLDSVNALVGDENGDGLFFDSFYDEFNAIALHPEFTGSDPSLYDFVFSSQEGFGGAWAESIDDGDLFFFVRPTIQSGDQPVEAFLEASVIREGLGTTDNIDVDAIAFGVDGTLFLSFRSDELILGDVFPLGDGAIVAFEPGTIVYDNEGKIESLGQGTVQIVLSEDSMDGFVENAGLIDGGGLDVEEIGDLQGLDIDPAGGTFLGENDSVWPNLLITGELTGPRVLTTMNNGQIAMLNGRPLGVVAGPDASFIGLDGSGDHLDVTSISVIDERDEPLVIDLETNNLSPGQPSDTLYVGNGAPLSPGLLLFSLGSVSPGDNFSGLALFSLRFPGLYTVPFLIVLSSPTTDANGRFSFPITVPSNVTFDFNLLIQAANVTANTELSAPVVLAFDADGP